MASGSNADPFGGEEDIMASVAQLKAVDLKQILKDMQYNSQLRERPRLSGTKAELINRIRETLSSLKTSGLATGFAVVKEIIARNFATSQGRRPQWSKVAPANLNFSNANGSTYTYSGGGAYASSSSGIPHNKFANSASSSTYMGGGANGLNSTYNSRALPPAGPGTSSSARPHFKPSPFFTIKEWMAGPVWMAEVPKHQRSSVSAFFAVKPNQKALLLASSPQPHEIRLFGCTKPSYDAALNPNHPAHIEFPMSCDAKVNSVALTATLRGSKKAAGRVPPPNLNKDKALWLDGRPNRIDMVCTDTNVKHAILIGLCEVVRSDTLVEQLRGNKFTSKAQVVAGMRAAAEDDEIEAGDATLSLKCPLSYMRIKTPCRSTACTHVQCFDALSFYSVNEQTPSWSCPVCAKALKPDELFWDGYVQDILDRVPDSEDSVLVDPMGKWRTPNGKFSSEGHAVAPSNGARAVDRSSDTESEGAEGKSPVDKKPRISEANGEAAASGSGATSSKAAPVAVELLDTPSPPSTSAPAPAKPAAVSSTAANHIAIASSSPIHPGLSSGAATPRSASGRSSAARPRQPAVIDLTLSDDDDDQPVVASPAPAHLAPRPFTSNRIGSSSSLSSASNHQHATNGSGAAWPPGMAASSSRITSGNGTAGPSSAAPANGTSSSDSFTTPQSRRRPLSSSGEDDEDESSDRIQGPGKRFRPAASALFSARRLADDEFESDDGGSATRSNGANSNAASRGGVNGTWASDSGSRGGGGSFSAAFMRGAGSGQDGARSGSSLSASHDGPFRNGAGASRAFRWGPGGFSPGEDRSGSWSSAGGASGPNDSPLAPSTSATVGHGNGGGEQRGSAPAGFQGSSALFRDEDEEFEEAVARDEELRRAREHNEDLDGWGLMEQATGGEDVERHEDGSGGEARARSYFDSPM